MVADDCGRLLRRGIVLAKAEAQPPEPMRHPCIAQGLLELMAVAPQHIEGLGPVGGDQRRAVRPMIRTPAKPGRAPVRPDGARSVSRSRPWLERASHMDGDLLRQLTGCVVTPGVGSTGPAARADTGEASAWRRQAARSRASAQPRSWMARPAVEGILQPGAGTAWMDSSYRLTARGRHASCGHGAD